MNRIISKSVYFLLMMLATTAVFGQGDESGMAEIVEDLREPLDLSEKQVGQMQTLLTDYRAKMDGILLKYEGQEEPDVGKMIAEIRGARDGYRKELQGILSKDQYSKYMAKVDEVMNGMFNDLAEIKLIDFQPKFDLTDKQVESLAPVFGKSMLSTVRLLFENAGTRLSLPKKVSIANALKKIDKEKRNGMEQIMTPEQLAAYDKYQEELKASK